MKKIKVFLVVALLFLMGAETALARQAAAPPAPAETAATAPALSAYRLGAGDKIRLTVFGEPSLSGEYEISSVGKLAMPLIGDVMAGERTTAELQEVVEAALRNGYLREPRVSIEVLNYRPFYVLGEVSKPGLYPYQSNLSVLNAIATANGFTYRADKKWVYIKRAAETAEQKIRLDATVTVAPGDTIRIGERFF